LKKKSTVESIVINKMEFTQNHFLGNASPYLLLHYSHWSCF